MEPSGTSSRGVSHISAATPQLCWITGWTAVQRSNFSTTRLARCMPQGTEGRSNVHVARTRRSLANHLCHSGRPHQRPCRETPSDENPRHARSTSAPLGTGVGRRRSAMHTREGKQRGEGEQAPSFRQCGHPADKRQCVMNRSPRVPQVPLMHPALPLRSTSHQHHRGGCNAGTWRKFRK